MKPLHWYYEPGTRDRYVRDQYPDEPIPFFSVFKTLPAYTPPVVWREFRADDPRWDSTFVRRFGKEYANNAQHVPDDPVPISAALLQMGKSYARTNGNTRVIGLPGVMFWAWWPRIDPCWVVITRSEVYKLLTEEEVGVTREGKVL